MPMPKPQPNERDFISRCMADAVMKKEYPDTSQRLAICQKLSESKDIIERENRIYILEKLTKKESLWNQIKNFVLKLKG